MEDKKKKKRTHLLIQSSLNTQPYLIQSFNLIEILAKNKKTIFLSSKRTESLITFSQFLLKIHIFLTIRNERTHQKTKSHFIHSDQIHTNLRARSIALSPPSNREAEDLSPLRKGNFPLDPFATN